VTVLVRVEAPHFVAGLLVDDGVCFAAAPILGWCVGKTDYELRTFFSSKGWKATIVRDKLVEPVVEG
jgi:hypothetical protein